MIFRHPFTDQMFFYFRHEMWVWQIALAPDAREKTFGIALHLAFASDEGLLQFTVLPFGVLNGTSSLQRFMENILKPCLYKICYVHLDDGVVFLKDLGTHVADLSRQF